MTGETQHPVIEAEEAHAPVTITYVPREIVIYGVSQTELELFASGYNSIHLTLFGLAGGMAFASGITLLTISMGARTFGGFVALLAVAGFLAIYFGARAFVDQRTREKQIEQIKAERRMG